MHWRIDLNIGTAYMDIIPSPSNLELIGTDCEQLGILYIDEYNNFSGFDLKTLIEVREDAFLIDFKSISEQLSHIFHINYNTEVLTLRSYNLKVSSSIKTEVIFDVDDERKIYGIEFLFAPIR